MGSCSSACTVPITDGTRADATITNDIYGFGGSALSSAAQNHLWSSLSDGSWNKILPSSANAHLRTSWPQVVPKMDPVSAKWDGDTLISVSSNDDAQRQFFNFTSISLYSTSRHVWTQLSNSAVSLSAADTVISSESHVALAGSQFSLSAPRPFADFVPRVFASRANCSIRR